VITPAQIAPFRKKEIDYDETEQLKAKFAKLRRERRLMYLTAEEFDEILRWKLIQQYGRGRALRAANTDDVVRAVTGTALTITHADEDYEIELRVGILCTLRGVGVPVASAVLALIYPEKYAVIDFSGWRQVFGRDRRMFSIADYEAYLFEIRKLTDKLGWPVQEVDHAIWEYDNKRNS
jgi:hypothetical protein